jgi:HK97 family phage major capsid protein
MSGNHSDAMIERLEKEIEERSSFIEGTIAQAQDDSRDLSDNETELTTQARKRIEACDQQLQHLYESRTRTTQARQRAHDVHAEMNRLRNQVDTGPVEYRSAGEYALDSYKSTLGDRDARERLEIFHRTAAHQKTSDNLGVVPDPIVGNVINFIDAARPIVSFIGPQPLTAATWHRPHVTQHTSVGAQGSAGAAGDEKTELVSQKMLITRITANAVTYGGYVNVSRQNIDFSQPQIMDLIINDLAAQYAIETEAAVAAELATTSTVAVTYATDASDVAAAVHGAVWEAAATVYTAVKGQGRLVLAVAPDVLSLFGPLFAPVNPRDAASPGMTAGQFGQGVMGTIGGVPVVMSAGLAEGEAFMFSTAAIEAFEQRVGTLQVTEPSVLGVQVAYAGYFTPLTIEEDGIVPLEATTG